RQLENRETRAVCGIRALSAPGNPNAKEKGRKGERSYWEAKPAIQRLSEHVSHVPVSTPGDQSTVRRSRWRQRRFARRWLCFASAQAGQQAKFPEHGDQGDGTEKERNAAGLRRGFDGRAPRVRIVTVRGHHDGRDGERA